MPTGAKGMVALAVTAIAVVAITYADRVSNQGRAEPTAATIDYPAGDRITLDPRNFQGPVREAYAIAERRPGLLTQLHCYCGCDKQLGHKNLLDCYRDSHASRCEICVGETQDAGSMSGEGTPVEQIRDTLRARYAHGS